MKGNGLTFRQDYFDDPAGWSAVKALILDIFDVDITPLDTVGGHDQTSFPSAFFDETGCCIANLSAFAMPLVIDGRAVKAAGWQSGAVRPEYRGQGLFRDLIRTTLDRCEKQGYEAIVLYTEKPGLYEPYGFRAVPQYVFKGAAPPPANGNARARSLTIEADLARLRSLLADRTPVSHHFAVADQSKMFLLNCHLLDEVRLSLLTGDQTVIAWRMTPDHTFQLLDVVGRTIPTLAEILDGLDLAPTSVESFIPPDRLSFPADPVLDTGPLVFMMRAADSLRSGGPFCLSPMAEF